MSERDAILIGIDPSSLDFTKGESVGFGGTFRTRMINRPVVLTFRTGENELRLNYSAGFRVVPVPTDLDREQREKLLRYTPSVLGMDILAKFKTTISKRRVELTYNE